MKRDCRECGKTFETENDRVRYCEEHRRREKPLKKINDIDQCSTCLRILRECEAGLEVALDEIERLRNDTVNETERSRRVHVRAIAELFQKPDRFERRLERFGWLVADKLAAEKMLSTKSISEMTRFHRSTVRRHLSQHLVPLGYLRRSGRTIEAGVKLGQGFPRYTLHYVPEKTHWLGHVGYFGFTDTDIEDSKTEFGELDNKLKLASEELVLFWLKTRLRQIEKEMLSALYSEDIDAETKAIMLHGVRLVIKRSLKSILAHFAPTLSKSGTKLDMLREDMLRVTDPKVDPEQVDLVQILETVDEMEKQKSPLQGKRLAPAMVSGVVSYLRHKFAFGKPVLIVDWDYDQLHRHHNNGALVVTDLRPRSR